MGKEVKESSHRRNFRNNAYMNATNIWVINMSIISKFLAPVFKINGPT